jgi:hypothetical protein
MKKRSHHLGKWETEPHADHGILGISAEFLALAQLLLGAFARGNVLKRTDEIVD